MANDTITFSEGDKEITLVMYSGITNKLMSCVNLDDLGSVINDPELHNMWIDIMLSDYSDNGDKKGYKFPPFKLSNANRTLLISWGVDNIVDFLLETNKSFAKTGERIVKSSNVTEIG